MSFDRPIILFLGLFSCFQATPQLLAPLEIFMRLTHLVAPFFLCVSFLLVFVGCKQGLQEETLIFQEAEALYRAGDYDGAEQRYQTFLETYPKSPFARTATLRQKTITREMDSVMSTRGTNRPLYIRPTMKETRGIIDKELKTANKKPLQGPLDAPIIKPVLTPNKTTDPDSKMTREERQTP